MSGTPIAGDYIKAEGKAGRMGARLMAIVAEGERGRVYLAADVGAGGQPRGRQSRNGCRKSLFLAVTQFLGVKPYGMRASISYSLIASL